MTAAMMLDTASARGDAAAAAGPPASPGGHHLDDEEIAEVDSDGNYCRYRESVGKGRFKEVYKAFNSQMGIDVAWSKVSSEANNLSEEQLHSVAEDMRKGLELDHPNIIKCFRCWEDVDHGCINLITELFTSGNLRQYRNMHKHLDLKAVKRMAKQILKGLAYLHGMDPSITHGDLRCDKIYVNGHRWVAGRGRPWMGWTPPCGNACACETVMMTACARAVPDACLCPTWAGACAQACPSECVCVCVRVGITTSGRGALAPSQRRDQDWRPGTAHSAAVPLGGPRGAQRGVRHVGGRLCVWAVRAGAHHAEAAGPAALQPVA